MDEPNNMLLTEESALKFFPTIQEAVGSTLKMGERTIKVTGVLEDVPENSHKQFDALLSKTTITSNNPDFNDQWGSNFLNTYLLLTNDVDESSLEAKFDDFLVRHMGENSEDSEVLNYY